MPYKLYTDKNENFTCEVAVKNASTKNAFARMIVESDDVALMFNGELKDGKCTVPIRRLKGFLDENAKGKMHLEIVVEDTFFKPWQDNFIVEQHTSVKVKVNEQEAPSKPIVEVRNISKTKISIPASDLLFIFERVGITTSNLSTRSQDFKQVIKEYFKSSPEFIKDGEIYIKEALEKMK